MGTPARGGGTKGGSMTLFWTVIALAAVLLFAYLAKTGGGSGKVSSEANRPAAPDLGVTRLGDPQQSVDLASLKGRVVVLHFWATWCPPCRAEFPQFARFATAEQSDSAVAVLPISVDETPDPVKPFLAGVGGTFPVFMDTRGMADGFKVTAIPTTIVVDKKGRVAWRNQGAADWSKGGVPAVVARLSSE